MHLQPHEMIEISTFNVRNTSVVSSSFLSKGSSISTCLGEWQSWRWRARNICCRVGWSWHEKTWGNNGASASPDLDQTELRTSWRSELGIVTCFESNLIRVHVTFVKYLLNNKHMWMTKQTDRRESKNVRKNNSILKEYSLISTGTHKQARSISAKGWFSSFSFGLKSLLGVVRRHS